MRLADLNAAHTFRCSLRLNLVHRRDEGSCTMSEQSRTNTSFSVLIGSLWSLLWRFCLLGTWKNEDISVYLFVSQSKSFPTILKILWSPFITYRVPPNLAVSTYLELCLSLIHPVPLIAVLMILGEISLVAFLISGFYAIHSQTSSALDFCQGLCLTDYRLDCWDLALWLFFNWQLPFKVSRCLLCVVSRRQLPLLAHGMNSLWIQTKVRFFLGSLMIRGGCYLKMKELVFYCSWLY